VVAFLVLVAVYAVSFNTDGGDGFLALPAAHSLLHHGDLDLSEYRDAPWYDRHYGMVEVEGRQLDYFPWTTAALTVPLLAVWEAASAVGVTPPVEPMIRSGDTGRLRVLFASMMTAAAAVVLGLVTLRLSAMIRRDGPGWGEWLAPDARWALTTWSVVLGLGTALWSTASRSLWQHGPSLLAGAGALWCLLHLVGRGSVQHHAARWAASAGALLALAYWARPTNALLSLFVIGVLVARRRDVLAPLLGAAALTHLAVLGANLALVGRAMPPYYRAGRIGWHDALPEAVAANLFSPARGVLLFSPFLLAAPAMLLRSRRSLMDDDTRAVVAGALATSVASLLVVSAFTEKWWAGHSIGPRFMTETVVLLGPLALVAVFGPRRPSAGGRRRAVWSIAIALSVAIHLGAATSGDARCWNTVPADVDVRPERVWSWADAQVLEPMRSTLHRWSGRAPGRCDDVGPD
jgi:hypothetical protein